MAGLQENAGLLLRIKADTSDATQKLAAAQKELDGYNKRIADGEKIKAALYFGAEKAVRDYTKAIEASTKAAQEAEKAAASVPTKVQAFKKELTELEKESKKSGSAVEQLAAQTGISAGQFKSIAGGVAIAVAGIGAVASAAVATTAKLFDLAKGAAEFGGKIEEAMNKTGLGAETLSGLKYRAEQAGLSLDQITEATARFSRTVGEAADGSEKATAILTKFGVDPVEAMNDLDGSLEKVFKSIVQARSGVEQMALAQLAFGRSGAQMIDFLKSFDGDLKAATESARELGLVIDDEAARAAAKFEDQLSDLNKQLEGVGRTIGQEVMPVFMKMAQDISGWLKENQGQIKAWGQEFAYWLTRAKDVILEVSTNWEALQDAFAVEEGRMTYAEREERGRRRDVIRQQIFNRVNRIDAGSGSWQVEDEFFDYKTGRMFPPGKRQFGTDDADATGKKTKDIFKPSRKAQAIIDAANKLGISPLDLATIIGFETGGSYSPSKVGGEGNKYRGLIQFGPEEQKRYGVTKGQSFEDQIAGPVVKFFKDRFAGVGKSTEGASILDLYRTVLGGNPNASLTGKDSFGTSPMSGVARMMRSNRPDALKRFFGGDEKNARGDGSGSAIAGFNREYERELKLQESLAKDIVKIKLRIIEDAAQREFEIGQTTTKFIIDDFERQYTQALEAGQFKQAEEAARNAGAARIQLVRDEVTELQRLFAERTAAAEALEKEAAQTDDQTLKLELQKQALLLRNSAYAIYHTLEQKTINLQTAETASNDRLTQSLKKITDAKNKQNESWRRHIDLIDRQNQAQWEAEDRQSAIERGQFRDQAEGQGFFSGALGQGIMGGLGALTPVSMFGSQDEVLSQAEFMKNVWADMSTSIGQSIGQLTQAMAGLITQWLITGEISGKAALKMAAGAAIGIAIEAGLQALFQYAKGVAAAANPLTASLAPGYFLAAKAYAKVAAVAGAIGIGTGLAARALGGGSQGPGQFSGSGGNQQQQSSLGGRGEAGNQFSIGRTTSPFQRPLEIMNEIVRRNNEVMGTLQETNEQLATRLQSIPPSDVIRLGAKDAANEIFGAVKDELGADSKASEQFFRETGQVL